MRLHQTLVSSSPAPPPEGKLPICFSFFPLRELRSVLQIRTWTSSLYPNKEQNTEHTEVNSSGSTREGGHRTNSCPQTGAGQAAARAGGSPNRTAGPSRAAGIRQWRAERTEKDVMSRTEQSPETDLRDGHWSLTKTKAAHWGKGSLSNKRCWDN